jgi:hypothetical protein
MHAIAKFTLDENHFRQAYADWLRYVSRKKRWELPVGALLLVLGLALWWTCNPARFLPLALMAMGLFEISSSVLHKHRWVRARLARHTSSRQVEMVFTDEHIRISGAYADAVCDWQAFAACVPTPHGMFLSPQKGVHIYIPDSALVPLEAKPEILSRIRPQGAGPDDPPRAEKN